MTTTTDTYRDFNAELPEEGQFSLDTSGDDAVFTFAFEGRTVTAMFDRDTARGLGTDLMQWIGSPLCSAYDEYRTTNGAGFELDVVDGQPEIQAAQAPAGVLGFEPNYDQAVDIARRLIVWAGVS